MYAEFTQKRFSMDVIMPFKKTDGSDVTLPMVVLTGRELMEAKKAAEKMTMAMYDGKMPKKDEASSYTELYEENLCWQLISYSIRFNVDLKKRFFPNVDAALDMITPDQAGILKNCYIELQLNQPWVINLNATDEERIEGMMQKLIEDGTSSFFLNSLTSVSQNLLIRSLASKLKNAMMESGTHGMPAEDITTNS